jgi:predicted RNase H-like nuclease (RuvC/YqgF family)
MKRYENRIASAIKRAVRNDDIAGMLDVAVEEAKLAYEFNPNSHSMGCLSAILQVQAMHSRFSARNGRGVVEKTDEVS